MTGETTPIGSIHVSPRAVARIAHQAALESYGVVGLAPKNRMNNLTNVLVKDPMQGVEVHYDGEKIIIDMYIVIEYGTRIKSVASSVANTVKYHVEKALGMPVTQVNIHVSGLRISSLN
ncbi:MAG: Asp23/Gls24 family envelope stress response protein [Anaerolineales bacterium]|nr:Asp23/Gls24 family envelope stress response protein [Anaerolineales bacterium]